MREREREVEVKGRGAGGGEKVEERNKILRNAVESAFLILTDVDL